MLVQIWSLACDLLHYAYYGLMEVSRIVLQTLKRGKYLHINIIDFTSFTRVSSEFIPRWRCNNWFKTKSTWGRQQAVITSLVLTIWDHNLLNNMQRENDCLYCHSTICLHWKQSKVVPRDFTFMRRTEKVSIREKGKSRTVCSIAKSPVYKSYLVFF